MDAQMCSVKFNWLSDVLGSITITFLTEVCAPQKLKHCSMGMIFFIFYFDTRHSIMMGTCNIAV